MTARAELHAIVDALPEQDLLTAVRVLRNLQKGSDDPLAEYPRSLREAPFDDEPVTDEDFEAIAEARAEIASGLGVPHQDTRRLLLGT